MNLDDLENLLEGVLAALKARKEIEPLRKENSELRQKLETVENDCKKLSEEKNSLQKNFDDLQNDLREFEPLRKKNSELLKKLETVENNFEKLSEEKKSLQQRFDNLRNENSNLKSQFERLQKNLSTAESEANYYRENFSDLDEIYKIYLTLDDDTKFDLAGVLGEGENVTGFFSGAVQESHLAPFWDYVSRHFEDKNFDKLCKLFDFCFEMFNQGFREPPFIRLNVEQGNSFDDEIMRRTPYSPQIGSVKKIFLQGYKYRVGNVVKPSVVEIQ